MGKFFSKKKNSRNIVTCGNCNTKYAIEEENCPYCGIRHGSKQIQVLDKDFKVVDSYELKDRMLYVCHLGESLGLYYDSITKVVYMGQKYSTGLNVFERQSYCPFYSGNGKLMKYDEKNKCLIEIN